MWIGCVFLFCLINKFFYFFLLRLGIVGESKLILLFFVYYLNIKSCYREVCCVLNKYDCILF